MNRKHQHLIQALLIAGTLALTVPQAALAAGTAACTTINNRASVTYEVGGVTQATKQSLDGNHANADAATYFYVGVKVDFTLTRTDNAPVTVYPNDVNKNLGFTLTNNSNATLNFVLTATNKSAAAYNIDWGAGDISYTDNFEATAPATPGVGSPSVYVENVLYAAPLTLVPYTVAADTKTVQIRASIPSGRANDDLSVLTLTAQAQWIGGGNITNLTATAAGNIIGDATYNATCNALAATTVDVVVADPAGDDGASDTTRDGKIVKRDVFMVSAAGLTITKRMDPYWDPVNLFSSPKAIPGAVVTYTVAIANAAGAQTASSIVISDSLAAAIGAGVVFGNTVHETAAATFNNAANSEGGSAKNCADGRGILYIDAAGTSSCKSNIYDTDDDQFTWNDATGGAGTGAANSVYAKGLSVAASETIYLKYQATIQ